MRAAVRAAAAVALCAATACAGESAERPAPPPDPAPPAAGVAPADTAWEVTATGLGPVRVGTPYAELGPRLELPVTDSAAIAAGCGYVRVRGAPEGLLFMVEQQRLARVEVRGGPTRTAQGAGIGDTEERIRSLYPELRTTPHKYVDGHYLIVIPGAPADTLHRIVFETDGERVTSYRAGVYPPVEYVEGCS